MRRGGGTSIGRKCIVRKAQRILVLSRQWKLRMKTMLTGWRVLGQMDGRRRDWREQGDSWLEMVRVSRLGMMIY